MPSGITMRQTDAAMLDALRLMLGFAPIYKTARGPDQVWDCDADDVRAAAAARRGWDIEWHRYPEIK